MDLRKIGDMVVDAAPGIAGILAATGVGTPVAGAVAALGALGRAFGLGDGAKPEDIEKAIQQDPQAALKLRLAELDYNVLMRKLDIDQLRAETEPYIEELRAKTVPWVDGLHKLGRQIANYYTITIVFILLMTGHALTPEAAALIGGPNLAYQLIKGKGKDQQK